jgi:hypothetical protein
MKRNKESQEKQHLRRDLANSKTTSLFYYAYMFDVTNLDYKCCMK